MSNKQYKIPSICQHLPCDTIRVSSYYGYRIHPITHKRTFHNGIDIASLGNLYAPFRCTVEDIYWNDARGNVVILQFYRRVKGHYIRFLAQHLAKGSIKVHKGDSCFAGNIIATLGNTGKSAGVHLHYEIHISKDKKNWEVINPLEFITNFKSQTITHTLSIENDEKSDGYVLEVKKLQELLNQSNLGVKLQEDGLFGGNTENALKLFQKKYGLKEDGICGGKTLDKLLELFPKQL